VDPERFQSQGRNTPFANRTLHGQVLATWCGGAATWTAPEWADRAARATAP